MGVIKSKYIIKIINKVAMDTVIRCYGGKSSRLGKVQAGRLRGSRGPGRKGGPV